MNLWLIRHGKKDQYIGDVSKIKLTEKGHRQADYTKWQENLYEDMTLDELCKKADAYWNETH